MSFPRRHDLHREDGATDDVDPMPRLPEWRRFRPAVLYGFSTDRRRRIRYDFAHEALVRGSNGEGAYTILSAVDDANRYTFDQQCRVMAIEMAARLRLADDGACLSINFMPNAVYEPRACIRLTLDAAKRTGFPLDRIIFEFTETERLDTDHLLNILTTYKAIGFKTAIDDFGAGYAGLQLLSQFQPDIVKIDMALVRGIDADPVKRSMLRHTLRMLEELEVSPLCEGVETFEELAALQDLGVRLIQGYVLAKPSFEALVAPRFLTVRNSNRPELATPELVD